MSALKRTALTRSAFKRLARRVVKRTDEARARRVVYARSGGICEVCDCRRASEWHHRKNRSQGGRWCPANGLHLCTSCHRHITVNPTTAKSKGWTVLSGHDPSRVAVWLTGRGWCLLSPSGDVTPDEGVGPWLG